MKTLNSFFSIAAIALCCSTAAFAEQNASAKLSAMSSGSCEELVITAQRDMVQPTAVFSIADRSALSASLKAETRQEIRQSVQQSLTETLVHAAQTVLQNSRHEALQASL